MRIADSSFLYTLVDASDARRERALGWLADSELIGVPPEVASETLGLLYCRKGFRAASQFYGHLSTKAHVRFLDSSNAQEVHRSFLAGQGRLSWVDAAVVHWCKKTNSAPLCFDPDIEAAVREPSSNE